VYDAAIQILGDNYIHEPKHFIDVLTFRVMSQDVLDFNRPVHLLVLMVDALIWGRNPLGYHLTSNLIHAGCAGLLYLIVRRWLIEDGARTDVVQAAAMAAGVVFAIHPLCTEAATEPSFREDLLAGFFMLLALWLAGRWSGAWRGNNAWPAVGILVCTLGAIGSKEIGVATVPVLGLYWLLRRFRRDRSLMENSTASELAGYTGASAPDRKWSWLNLLTSAATVAGAFVIARFALEPVHSKIFNVKATYLGGSLAEAMNIQPRIWAFYLRHIVWPDDLCADYTGYSLRNYTLTIGWIAVGSVVAVQLLLAWFNRLMALSMAIFWLTLLPASNLMPQFRPVADRYCYVPMMGVALAVAALVALLWRARPLRITIAVVMALASVPLIVVCVQRQWVFSSSVALWTDTVAKNPNSVTATGNLGWAKMDAGDLPGAIDWFSRAIKMSHGKNADAYAGAALALEATGQPDKATWALGEANKITRIYRDPELLKKSLTLTGDEIERLKPIIARLPPTTPGR